MKQKKAIIGVIALVIVAAALFFLWRAYTPQGQPGQKTITVDVIHGDGSVKTFELETEAAYLGTALVEQGVVVNDQSDYGLYIKTVDGETANENAEEWWSVTKDGEMLNTGADTTPIQDGEHFELTLMVGYDSF